MKNIKSAGINSIAAQFAALGLAAQATGLPDGVRIGSRAHCENFQAATDEKKGRGVIILGKFWDESGRRLMAVFTVASTTKIGAIYKSEVPLLTVEAQKAGLSNRPSKINFANTFIAPNTREYFAPGAYSSGRHTVAASLWPAIIAARAYALTRDPRLQHGGLTREQTPANWIYEGLLFDLPSGQLDKNAFAPDVRGAVFNQRPWLPPGMTRADSDRITGWAASEENARPLTAEQYLKAGHKPF